MQIALVKFNFGFDDSSGVTKFDPVFLFRILVSTVSFSHVSTRFYVKKNRVDTRTKEIIQKVNNGFVERIKNLYVGAVLS